MQSLENVGRGIERKRVKSSKASEPEKRFIDKNGLEQGNSLVELIEDAHTSYVNNFNVWKKKIINKVSLGK